MSVRCPVKINAVFFKEQITASFGTETDSLFQRMDDRNQSDSINKQSLKKSNAYVRSSKKKPFLVSSCCQKISIPYNSTTTKNGWLQDDLAINTLASKEWMTTTAP